MKNSGFILTTLLLLSMAVTTNAQSALMAKQYAHEAAEKLMKSISPNTGKNASAEVSEVEWDENNQRYIIEMEASWRAGQCFLCDEEDFIVRGILKVGKNGNNPNFKETYKNAAVQGAWTDDQIGAIFAGVATLASASSNTTGSQGQSSESGYVYIRNNHNANINFSLSCDESSYTSYSLTSGGSGKYRCNGNPVYIRLITTRQDAEVNRVNYKLNPGTSYKLEYNNEKSRFDVFYD